MTTAAVHEDIAQDIAGDDTIALLTQRVLARDEKIAQLQQQVSDYETRLEICPIFRAESCTYHGRMRIDSVLFAQTHEDDNFPTEVVNERCRSLDAMNSNWWRETACDN